MLVVFPFFCNKNPILYYDELFLCWSGKPWNVRCEKIKKLDKKTKGLTRDQWHSNLQKGRN